MRFLLSTIGTMGDVIPFVEIAKALQSRGHETLLLANGNFQELAERNGIAFHALGTKEEYLRLAENKDLYHPLRGVKEMARQWVFPSIRRTLEYLRAHPPEGGGTVLVGAPLTLGLRLAQERHRLPYHSVVLSPFMLPSVHLAPVSPGFALPEWTPRPFHRAFQAIADRGLDGILKPGLNAMRAELGMAPLTSAVRSWWLSPSSVAGVFPAWFAPVQPDWPAALRLTGFLPAPADAAGDLMGSAELDGFLAGDARLAVVTMGSILTGNEWVARGAVEACVREGLKVLLLTANSRVLAQPWPGQVKQAAFVPLATVLRRASLLVHHAGIGTASAALSAGTPQLLIPHGHDQFDNAARLLRLGVAKAVEVRGPSGLGRLAIGEFLADEGVAAACRRARDLCAAASGMDEMCRLLESA